MDLGGCRVDQLWYIKSTHNKPFCGITMIIHFGHTHHIYSHLQHTCSPCHLFNRIWVASFYMKPIYPSAWQAHWWFCAGGTRDTLCESKVIDAMPTHTTQQNKTKQSPIICHFSLFVGCQNRELHWVYNNVRSPTPTMNNGECGDDHPEFRKSTHTKARPLVSQWESHWSHLLLVHHAIIHLSMSSKYSLSLSLCMRPMCPGASSLVVFYKWHSRSKLKTQIYCCDSNKPNASNPNQTKPNHLSLLCIFMDHCQNYWIIAKVISEWERDVREQGMLHLDPSHELLCELELGLQSRGVSWI